MKITVEDKDSTYMVETPKDPAQPVPLVQLGFIIHWIILKDASNTAPYFFQIMNLERINCSVIAEACIEVEAPKRMEDVANSYFDILVHEEVIIQSNFDKLTDRQNTKSMHLKLLLGTFEVRLDRTLSDALKNFKQLRTLLVLEDCGAVIKQLPSDIFLGLNLLRTLDLSRTHISELPGSIGTVESLRYLDVSETPIKRLPESTDRLLFLQTLKLRAALDFLYYQED
ncbi:hypothetical protein Sango_0838600 [Sesamum angolense]|uniref:Uncharacterized protein n=1 Tax=Sesamum angolense TaxID=2727404 RepID=A0AAE1X3R8_9LAMI|nr:hypothetical protein Sango_0838600 [Sesamum angolense]